MFDVLDISFNGERVGALTYDPKDELFIIYYDDAWKKDGFPLSPHIPIDGHVPPRTIERFLRNLLPEGRGLDGLARFIAASKENTFALIREIGRDVSGALIFGQLPLDPAATFRVIGKKELSERIDEMDTRSIALWDGKERSSVAGVQEKLPVFVKEGQIGLGDGSLASTHILKFERRIGSHVILNEYFCMRLAKLSGLETADVELKRFGRHSALLVKRFDRKLIDSGHVERIHVIDGCQALDLSPILKYEREGGIKSKEQSQRRGVSFKLLFDVAKNCRNPARSSLFVLRWAIFNLIISNADAHGKNISFLLGKKGMEPAPLYDMLSIAMHPEYAQEVAIAFGDEFDPNAIKPSDLHDFSEAIGYTSKLVSKQVLIVSLNIKKALAKRDIDSVVLSSDEKAFVEKLEKLIIGRADAIEMTAKEM